MVDRALALPPLELRLAEQDIAAFVRDRLASPKLLQELHPRDREIIKLSMWEGMSPDEIAAVLDVTPETARQRLHRARKRLTQKYKKEYSSESDPPLLRKEVSGEH